MRRASCSNATTHASHQSIKEVRQASRAFAEADSNNDHELDFEEFVSLQPRQVQDSLSGEELQAMFQAADIDGGGTISVDEFFLFSLSVAAFKHSDRDSMQAIFEKFDKDKTGFLCVTCNALPSTPLFAAFEARARQHDTMTRSGATPTVYACDRQRFHGVRQDVYRNGVWRRGA